ncbi:acyl carrier protein [Micromonospora sp. C95]|uniref:acyl carrier protein n=1 Tax=Micromonospora sp. C95 TaxID=2824882 RepID=UPI001B362147|nr:phosphopantetheine-binding protein [Micromonospora sp. C95]MBQ1026057.1 hypothetical protein [Micromonospora sp. C95]
MTTEQSSPAIDPDRRETLRRLALSHDTVAEAEPFWISRDRGWIPAIAVVPKSFASAVEIRNFLRANDPGTEPPQVIGLLGALPRDEAGEVHPDMLPELVAGLDPSQLSEYLPPETEAEAVVCELIGTITGAVWVSPLDDFIDLGGTSIDTVQLSARIHERYGVTLALEEIFEASTPRAISRLIEAARSR